MGRRIAGLARRILILSVITLAAAALTTCDNPIDFLEQLEIAVKEANNKFLVVTLIGPVKNATQVNPGERLVIEFDRPIEPATALALVEVTDGVTSQILQHEYKANIRTLYLHPDPYLDGPASYTVRVPKGVLGTDGSTLKEDFVWSFTTREYPAGSIIVNGGDPYTNSTSAMIEFFNNPLAEKVRYGIDEGAVLGLSWVSPVPASDTVVLPGGDGTKTIFAQFANFSQTDLTQMEEDSIVYDATDPVAEAGAPLLVNASTKIPFALTDGSATDNLSGIKSLTWLPTANVTFGWFFKTRTVTAAKDGKHTLTLRAIDRAGNIHNDTTELHWDRTPPAAPVFTVKTTPSPTDRTDLIWDWDPGEANATFVYSFDEEEDKTKGTSFEALGVKGGQHSFWVFQVDEAGNKSTRVIHDIYVSDPVRPLDTATDIDPAVDLLFEWPPAFKSTYVLYISGMKGGKYDTGSASEYRLSAGPLDYGTEYQWYVETTPATGRPYNSPTYRFKTMDKM